MRAACCMTGAVAPSGELEVCEYSCEHRKVKRKRLILGIGICFLVLVAAGFVLWPRETEPMYQGKSLSEWANAYQGYSDPSAPEALQSIGTNALPYLLRWIQYEPGAVRQRLAWVAHKMPGNSRSGFHRWLRGDKYYDRVRNVPPVFSVLRGRAAPAIPELMTLTNRTNRPVAIWATRCLQEIGREDPSGIR